MLTRQVILHLGHSASSFCIGYFLGLTLCLGWSGLQSFCQPVVKIVNFCSGWLWTEILSISTSQVARIIGLNHHAWSPFLSLVNSVCHVGNVLPSQNTTQVVWPKVPATQTLCAHMNKRNKKTKQNKKCSCRLLTDNSYKVLWGKYKTKLTRENI
jgi:hypothetical protein